MKTMNHFEIVDLEVEAVNDTQCCSNEGLELLIEESIYCLMDEEDVLDLELSQSRIMNDGAPSLEDLDELERYSRECLSRSEVPYLREEKCISATGYIQTLVNVEFDQYGNAFEKWKTVKKVTVDIEKVNTSTIKDLMYLNNVPYSKYTRIILYSAHLYSIVGYEVNSTGAKTHVLLDESAPNILIAMPTLSDVDRYVNDESWFSYCNKMISESINNGLMPYEALDRGSYQHWEMTKSFYEDVLPTLDYSSNEPLKKKSKYKSEIDIIRAINNSVSIQYLESLTFEQLTKVLFVARSKFVKARINDSGVFNLVVSIANNKDTQEIINCSEPTVQKINMINEGSLRIESLGPDEINLVLQAVWNRSNKLSIQDKDLYFKLKSIYYKSKKLGHLKLSA